MSVLEQRTELCDALAVLADISFIQYWYRFLLLILVILVVNKNLTKHIVCRVLQIDLIEPLKIHKNIKKSFLFTHLKKRVLKGLFKKENGSI